MTRRTLVALLVLAASVGVVPPLGAGVAGTDLFLPSVGSAPGVAPSVWYTTVWIFNPNGAMAHVELSFLPRDQSTTTPEHTAALDVGPGEVRQIDDAVATLFGIQGFGALRAESDLPVHMAGRIYSQAAGQQPRASAGQFFAASPAESGIAVGDEADLVGLTNLAGGDFRYNVGFVETTGAQIVLVLRLYASTGDPWIVSAVTLRPYEQKQMSVDALFSNNIGKADNFRLKVIGSLGAGRALVFGSRIANGSQDPTTFAAATSASP